MVRSEGDNDMFAVQKEIWDSELGDDDMTPTETEDQDQTMRRRKFFGTWRKPRARE